MCNIQIGSYTKNVERSRIFLARWTSTNAVQSDDSTVDSKGYVIAMRLSMRSDFIY